MLCQIWTTHTHTAGYWSPVNKSCVCVCVCQSNGRQWWRVRQEEAGQVPEREERHGAVKRERGEEEGRLARQVSSPEHTWTPQSDTWWQCEVVLVLCVCVDVVLWCQGLGPRQGEEAGLRSRAPRAVFSPPTHQPSAQTHEERLVSVTSWSETCRGSLEEQVTKEVELIWDL